MNPIKDITASLAQGRLIPYLGPAMLTLCPDTDLPATPEVLVAKLTAKASVPPKIKNQLSRAAQFIENFKHRKTVVNLMDEAFAAQAHPSELHRALAALELPLIVDSWYDDASSVALAERGNDWGQIQGLSQSEHFGHWTGGYAADGTEILDKPLPEWKTILYKPIGGRRPASNYLVSDTDYVEVLTEIDIQTPIPATVQDLRSGRNFLFIGCRFNDQLSRAFARQIMKRSSDVHWAVLPDEPTRMEARFLAEQNIRRIDMTLEAFARQFVEATASSPEVA